MEREEELLLEGATVQRVDVRTDLAVLRARTRGETFFVVIAAGRPGPLVGLTREKPFKGAALFSDPASGHAVPLGEKLRWRTRLEGAHIINIGERRILLFREGALFAVETAASSSARVTLREAKEEHLEQGPVAAGSPALCPWARASELEAVCARGEALTRSFGDGALAARRQALVRALSRATAKIERRMEAVSGDLARIEGADRIAAQAAAFVAEASRAARGARSLTATDWSSGEPRLLELKLDPARSAREQIEAMFKRARRLKQGAVIARQRLADAESAWERIGALAEQAREAASFEAIEAMAKEAKAAAPRDFTLGEGGGGGAGAKGAEKGAPSRPYRVFRGASGGRIWVGRGAANNDTLTFKIARPHDLWLHAKGRTGAHVIVPLEKNQSCPADLLIEAAHLAAHFSDAREEGVVEVQYTPRRYLRKPKGSGPGFVVVDREKVLVLRVERDQVARLVAGEEIG
jgi:predicted ribosome quality control (RQC) complex YloA/Tae2 family protein